MESKKVPVKYLFESPSVQKGEESEIKRNDFTFEKKLGEGAFGEVWKVIHKASKKVYAMKQVLKEKVSRMLPQFKREVYIMYNLNHPHIIKILNHFEDEKSFYLLMEFADGGNLYHRLHRQRQFIEVEAAQYFREVVLAVEYLHLHVPAIIHRDIKPENILLDSQGRVKLTDFGWSNYESGSNEAPRKTVCGTLEYLPPEMIEEKAHDTTVDIWCLGVLLYEMLVGFTPFKSQTQKNMLFNISKNKPKFPLSFPPLAKDLIIRMLAKDSKERLKITEVKEDRWLKEMNPIKETISQNLNLIPLPNYHDSIPLDFNSYEVVCKNIEVEDECGSDDFELSSDESSTEASDKLSTAFLEDVAFKHSIKIIQKDLAQNQHNLNKSKAITSDIDFLHKELSVALSSLESRVQIKTKELSCLLNNEKELQVHISDIEIQLSTYIIPSLLEDVLESVQKSKNDLNNKIIEISEFTLKKEEVSKEYTKATQNFEIKEKEWHHLQLQLFELKNSFNENRKEGSMQALDIQMQADIMQSKKDHHEQLAKALGEEDQLYAEEIKSFVSDLKSANSFNQDEIFQKINKTKEKIIQKENDLSNIKDIFDNKKNEIMQESKRNKEISTENKKSLEEDIKKEVLSLNNNEKENIREQLKRARELEHAYRIYGNEFEMIQRQIKVSYR